MIISPKIKIIAFDADDTLWVNEPYYRETEAAFTQLLKPYLPEEKGKSIPFRDGNKEH